MVTVNTVFGEVKDEKKEQYQADMSGRHFYKMGETNRSRSDAGDYTLQEFNGSVRCGHAQVATHSSSCHGRLQLALFSSGSNPTAIPSENHLSMVYMLLMKTGFLNQVHSYCNVLAIQHYPFSL